MRNLSTAPFESDPKAMKPLVNLALDLRNCWDHTTDPLWSRIDPELWSLTHNPWVVLQTASRTKLKALASDPEFGQRVRDLLDRRRQYLTAEAWFRRAHADSPLTCVAYFSMEFGLSEALPIYSGGLGNVAGDQLKAASDLGVPLVGVGLLYQRGYFRQIIDADGNQIALYPYNDPGQLPITPVRDKDGEWLRLNVILPGRKLWLRTWQAQVGRLTLYLLDSNDPANPPAYRGITSELYGGGPELRLAQELVLGIGGWRLLRDLGIKPEVCHLNEGHAAFAVVERARSFMEDSGQPFEVALAVTRAGNLFTTHTPVEAGFDRFAPTLIGRYLERYARERLNIDLAQFLALGRAAPGDSNEPFNMAYLAIRGSGTINGVSRLHGAVSRNIFRGLFPRWPEAEIPIGYVTNGVHTPTWDSAAADALWTESCGRERWRGAMETVGDDICCAADSALWELRAKNRLDLVRFVRERLASELAARGGDPKIAETIFDPGTLTLGFARRFATYKRPNLLLHDPQRLVRILTNPQRPVQLVIAGKAHPQDILGQAMIKAWVEFVRRPEVRRHTVFLSDYDLVLAERLVQGADLWINTPRRPWEACGTSGMKVLVNGGLNLSELDGWWAEAYSPQVGWALGDGKEHGDDPAWDAAEAEELYDMLEKKVIPAFYRRDEHGIPTEWVTRMRDSMSRLTPQFSANRAVREYTEKYYLPAAAAYHERATDHGAWGGSLLQWEKALAERWKSVRFGELRVASSPRTHSLQVEVSLGELRADWVCVQLYAASRRDEEPPFVSEMTRTDDTDPSTGWRIYAAEVPASRPASDYTPRIVPRYSGARIPLEEAHILWFR
ncbi:MAG TPA: alpha-glucan family phosphorylase [Candidatus Binataceae bacterium]|nr:alpha-glucan family phosphorylase [Candidatus Binataceae bacterium]